MNNNDSRLVAIYSRKSKFTGKGDSVGNQIEACKNHLKYKYPNTNFDKDLIIYEDEGFTGYNTNRPQFQKMINDITNKKIKCICCYRLDRISRNVSDFAELKETLEQYNVIFISITENFDTTTPLGNAMLMIASVFAQLERDTIAERIRDNMLELAKTGRWLGGTTPTGYKSEAITNITIDGKERKLFKLSPIDDEQLIIKTIFNKYSELKSQTKLETFLIQSDIKTKNNIDFSRFAIKNILQNPVYATADADTYKYFKDLEIEIYAEESEFNGKNGLMVYNKTEQKNGKRQKDRDIKDWIISVGKHKGLVSGKEWIDIQKLLDKNSDKRYRRPTKNNALLSGLLRCSYCGSFMRPKIRTYTDNEGQLAFNYMCELKEKSRGGKCNCKNINGKEVDKLVMDTVKELVAPNSKLYKSLLDMSKNTFKSDNSKSFELKTLQNSYKKNDDDIQNYVSKILILDGDSLDEVNKKIIELKNTNKLILEQINTLGQNSMPNEISDKENAEIVLNIIDTYFTTFDSLSLDIRRALLRALIHSIETDGETLTINLVGTEETKKNNFVPLGLDSK